MGVKFHGFLMLSADDPMSQSKLTSIASGRTTLADSEPTRSTTGERSMMKNINTKFAAFMQDDSGQDLIEYALVAGLIGLGAVVAMTGLSGKISTAFGTVGNNLTSSL
jgi:pilus assembly protein Flp/PilA